MSFVYTGTLSMIPIPLIVMNKYRTGIVSFLRPDTHVVVKSVISSIDDGRQSLEVYGTGKVFSFCAQTYEVSH